MKKNDGPAKDGVQLSDDHAVVQRPYTPAEVARFMGERSELSSLRRFLEKVLEDTKEIVSKL